MRHSIAVAAVALIGSGTTLSAQPRGTVEVGGFGQPTRFDAQTTLAQDPSWGASGLLGVFFGKNLALEGIWSRTRTEHAISTVNGTWDAWRARLVYVLPPWESIHPLIGAGYVHGAYKDAVSGDDHGITGLLGLKAYVWHRVALRSDVQLDYVWLPFNEGSTFGSNTIDHHTNWTVSTGFSIDIGRGPARDSDNDGVPNRDDACAGTPGGVLVHPWGCRIDLDGDGVFYEDDRCSGTPVGARVDARGCRVDTDGDGVFDDDDQCAGTPAGARVDARGCRVDTDGDGVFDEDDACGASEAGVMVDERGCPALFAPEATVVVSEGVTFEGQPTGVG